MKIKEFFIKRYGPLADISGNDLAQQNFNLFWGKNEYGKTLTIDALVKLLLDKSSRDFEHIERVEETPEGYVIIENEDEKEVKLPQKKKKFAEIAGLSPTECASVFIVRNSDLSIGRDHHQESEFYTTVTERLTGLRTSEINKIKDKARELAKITPSGLFRDSGEEKLKTRIEDAKKLKEEITALAAKTKEKRFDELEEEAAALKEAIENINAKINTMDDAGKREKYEKTKEALDNLKNYITELGELEIYSEDDYELWRDWQKELERLKDELIKLKEELSEKEKELQKVTKELGGIAGEFQILEDKKRKLEEEVKPDLRNYEEEKRGLAEDEEKSKFLNSAGIIAVVLLGLSLIGLIFRPSFLFVLLTILFVAIAFWAGANRLRLTNRKAKLSGLLEKIKISLAKLGLNAANFEEMLFSIQQLEDDYLQKAKILQGIEGEKESLEREERNLRQNIIPARENKIKEIEEKIEALKRKAKEDSLEEYGQKLKLKLNLQQAKEAASGILKSHFGAAGISLDENIAFWEQKVWELEVYKDKALGETYSEQAAAELKANKKETEEKLEEIERNMKAAEEELKEIERKANNILRPAEYLYCRTSVDLKAVAAEVEEFIKENEKVRENALEVIGIFEEIEAEEKEKVAELFGKESPASLYFAEITDGFYEEVIFSQPEGKISVRQKDGTLLEAEKLSGGAYDQLYFAIRLALAEKLFPTQKGFFILDDPFIKSDPERLQKQLKTLKKIAKAGWQILYFSAKGEVKEALKDDLNQKCINYIELSAIFAV